NQFSHHVVQIQQTLPLQSSENFHPVSGANVFVRELEGGRLFRYEEVQPGHYQSVLLFSGQPGYTYELEVQYEDHIYLARSTMSPIVPIDSIGVSQTTFMGETQRFITINFKDPAQIDNYYRYLIRLNDGPFLFVRAYNDRFND